MADWRSCDNCGVFPLTNYCTIKTNTVICDYWKPIPCQHCGGPLSEKRKYRYGGGPIGELARYNGKWYRHCYSCHAEIFAEE